MYAQDCFRQVTVDRTLDSPLTGTARIAVPGLERALGPAWWLASSVLVTIMLRLAGVAGEEAIMALAGSAALVYLGTAAVAGRLGLAALDLAAAVVSAGLAIGGQVGPATVMMVHVLWGALRASAGPAGPGRRFAAGWSIFFGASALLLGLSA